MRPSLPALALATARAAGTLALALAAGACGSGSSSPGSVIDTLPPAALSTSAAALDFAVNGSAPEVFVQAILPFQVISLSGDPTCPVQSQLSQTQTLYTGGCTDGLGHTFQGTMTLSRTAGLNHGSLTYQGFTVALQPTCGGVRMTYQTIWNGTLEVAPSGSANSFSVDLRQDLTAFDSLCRPASALAAWSYQGSYVSLTTNATLWNGSGKLGLSLSLDTSGDLGQASASTEGEEIDRTVCASEALSGSSSFLSGAHLAVVRYDGAADCNPASTVTWSYDGTARGTLTGVRCSADPGRGADLLPLLGLSGLAALALARRARLYRRPPPSSPAR